MLRCEEREEVGEHSNLRRLIRINSTFNTFSIPNRKCMGHRYNSVHDRGGMSVMCVEGAGEYLGRRDFVCHRISLWP